LLIESITFKLAVEFFKVLRKFKIEPTKIKIGEFNGKRYAFTIYNTFEDLETYFNTKYKIFQSCKIGNFIGISSFTTESNLHNFRINFMITNTCVNTQIREGKDYDNERNLLRESLKNRLKNTLTDLLSQYCTYQTEIRGIFTTGVYSPCYAENGWSEGTGRLAELRNTFYNTDKTFTIKL